MESELNIRASTEDIKKVFKEDDIIWIKYMQKIKDNLWRCIIRHNELPIKLENKTFTINGLRKILLKYEKGVFKNE